MVFIQEHLFEILTAIFALISIIVTVSLFYQGKKTKKLIYETTTKTNLINIEDVDVKSNLLIYYNGIDGRRELAELNLMILKIENIGNEPILAKDFDEVLEFSVDEDTGIYDIKIINEYMKNRVKIELDTINYNRFAIDPILINPSDFIELKLLTSKISKIVQTGGRIIGGTIEEKKETPAINLLYASLVGLLLFLISGIFYFLKFDSGITLFFMILGTVFMYGSLILRKSNRLHLRKRIKEIYKDFEF